MCTLQLTREEDVYGGPVQQISHCHDWRDQQLTVVLSRLLLLPDNVHVVMEPFGSTKRLLTSLAPPWCTCLEE